MSVLRALLDVGLVLLLPGWLLLRAAGWPRSQPERLLCAGPASIAVVAVLTALLGRAGVAPSLPWLVALELVLAVVAVLRRSALRDEERLSVRWYAALALPGVVLLAIAVVAAGGLVYPPAEDSLVHAAVLRWFLDGHAAPPLLADHLGAVATPEVRYGFHAFAALLVSGTGLDPARGLTAGTWAVVMLMPASLMLLARRAGLDWRQTVLAGVATLGVGIVPFKFLALGNVPLAAGAYVVAPAAAVAWAGALRLRTAGPVAVAAVLLGGLVFVHPSDVPTFMLLAVVLLPAALRPWRWPTPAEAVTVAAGAAAVLLLLVMSLHYQGHVLPETRLGGAAGDAVQDDAFFTARHFAGFVEGMLLSAASFPHDWLLPLLALAGLVFAWRHRAVPVVGALAVLLGLVQLDAWGWQVPGRLLARVYPWPSPDRLQGLDWFVLAPLAAVGAVALVERMRSVRRNADLAAARRVELLAATAAVAIAVIPAASFAPGMLERAHDAQTGLTAADVAAFPQVARHVPAGSLVLTDGVADGGAWLDIFTDRDTLLHKEWNHNTAAPSVRAALRGLCQPGAAARLRALGVSWVYLGPQPATSTGLADRSCAATGTAELTSTPLPDATARGPFLLHVTPAG